MSISSERLDKINFCLGCGSTDGGALTREHFYPKFLLLVPRMKKGGVLSHPLSGVVYYRHNWYRFCWDCHCKIEQTKHKAFYGDHYRSRKPDALVKAMQSEYRITEDEVYRPIQIDHMIDVNTKFIEITRGLNGEMGPSLKQRYIDAAFLATEFNDSLKQLK